MRREGFELGISRPRVLFRDGANGREEPYETVVIDVDEEYSGTVVDKMAMRKGEMTDMRPSGGGKTRMTFSRADPRPDRLSRRIPVRHARHGDHEPAVREIRTAQGHDRRPQERRPDLDGAGRSRRYALGPLEERGILFVSPGETLYEGMIIGENAKPQDLEVNPMKSKQLTNFRASGKDDAIRLTPPKRMTLEQAIAYIEDDELVEVTPKAIRMRKRFLDPHERKREARKLEAA